MSITYLDTENYVKAFIFYANAKHRNIDLSSTISCVQGPEEFEICRLHITWLLNWSFLKPANSDKNCQSKLLFGKIVQSNN